MADYMRMFFMLNPKNMLVQSFLDGVFSGRQTLYLMSVCNFAFYFYAKKIEEYDDLMKALANDSVSSNLLQR